MTVVARKGSAMRLGVKRKLTNSAVLSPVLSRWLLVRGQTALLRFFGRLGIRLFTAIAVNTLRGGDGGSHRNANKTGGVYG